MIAKDLAGESDSGDSAFGEDRLFGFRHLAWFAFDELHAAGGAAGFSTTSVELISASFLVESVDQSFVGGDIKSPDSFDGDLWHLADLSESLLKRLWP